MAIYIQPNDNLDLKLSSSYNKLRFSSYNLKKRVPFHGTSESLSAFPGSGCDLKALIELPCQVVMSRVCLLDNNLKASLSKSLLRFLSIFLADAFLDSLREARNEFLSLLKADTGYTTDSLESSNTLGVIYPFKNNIKGVLGFLLSSSASSSTWGCHHNGASSCSRCINTEGLFNLLDKLRSLKKRHSLKLFNDIAHNRGNFGGTFTIVNPHVAEVSSHTLNLHRSESSHSRSRGDDRSAKLCARAECHRAKHYNEGDIDYGGKA
mmetsp:Transcript_7392/g.10366  ORF Transcript_7392/g.10366 Transcript_7392/m.10366 type:complete len:265 (+) Transcript_7392:165-959(+)